MCNPTSQGTGATFRILHKPRLNSLKKCRALCLLAWSLSPPLVPSPSGKRFGVLTPTGISSGPLSAALSSGCPALGPTKSNPDLTRVKRLYFTSSCWCEQEKNRYTIHLISILNLYYNMASADHARRADLTLRSGRRPVLWHGNFETRGRAWATSVSWFLSKEVKVVAVRGERL